MSKSSVTVELQPEQQKVLEQWVRAHGTPQQLAMRCRIVLMSHQGYNDLEIAADLGVNRHTCRLWRERFVAEGQDGLWEVAEGRGRKPESGLAERIIKATLETKPEGQTHWSARAMAKEQGVDPSTVARIWQDNGIQPHRQETFKISRDPEFVAELVDVVAVYLNPPQNAVVLCVDEKSQIQALDRTQPGLPLTNKAVRRGSFANVPELIEAIEAFIKTSNSEPKPFIWRTSAESIIEKLERARRRLEQIKPGCTEPRGKKKVA